jgi:RNA polymerase sigma factor (sigma-70 family)
VQTNQNDTTTTPATAQDQQLVTAYQTAILQFGQNSQQAQEAFKGIFDRYYRTVQAYAHHKTSEQAEELAQETFLTVWLRLTSGRENITYLRGLVSHSFRCEYADLTRYNHIRPTPLSLDLNQETEGTNLYNLYIDEETQFSAAQAQDLLNQLPLKYRVAWEGKLAGKNYKQIAEENGWNENIVKKYIVLGRQMLQGIIAA